MTFKIKTLPTLLLIIPIAFILSCEQNNSNKNDTQVEKNISAKSFTIDTFSTFPPEVDGCSCYFSNNTTEFKQKQFIYMNDFAKTSFLKINGVLTKFTEISFKQINETTTVAKAKSEKFEMTIEVIDGIKNGDETWLKKGTIKLTDKNGTTIIKTFYGECGC